MLFGALFGILLNNIDIYNSLINQYLSNGVFEVIGKLFVNSLKMLVVPLVFCSITVGITSLGNLSLMGRIGLKAIIIYLLTTAFAISDIDEAYSAVATASGTAAIVAALLAVLKTGDHILMTDSAYGVSRNLAKNLLNNMGITLSLIHI